MTTADLPFKEGSLEVDMQTAAFIAGGCDE